MILAGCEQAAAQFASRRLGHDVVTPSAALAWVAQDDLVTAVAIFHDYYRGGNIDMGLFADRPFTPGFIKAIADYVFNQLGCSRITARPPASNESACNQLLRAGFRQEANCKAYYGTDDAIQMRMLRIDARKWL